MHFQGMMHLESSKSIQESRVAFGCAWSISYASLVLSRLWAYIITWWYESIVKGSHFCAISQSQLKSQTHYSNSYLSSTRVWEGSLVLLSKSGGSSTRWSWNVKLIASFSRENILATWTEWMNVFRYECVIFSNICSVSLRVKYIRKEKIFNAA